MTPEQVAERLVTVEERKAGEDCGGFTCNTDEWVVVVHGQVYGMAASEDAAVRVAEMLRQAIVAAIGNFDQRMQEAVAQEREACAQIAEERADEEEEAWLSQVGTQGSISLACNQCATHIMHRIRARTRST